MGCAGGDTRVSRSQIPIRAEVIGADHPDVLTMRSNFANALRAAGQIDEAEAEIESVFRPRCATLGDTHPDTLSAINVLGVIVNQRADYAKAEVLFRQASELYLKAKGPMHPETVMTQANYLSALRKSGSHRRGRGRLCGTAQACRAGISAGTFFSQVIRGHLGLSLMEAKRDAEAEPLLTQKPQDRAGAIWRRRCACADPACAVGRSVHALGKPEQAAEFGK